MTCVLNSTSITSATALPSMRWSPMTSTTDIPTHSTIGLPSQSSSYDDSPPGSVTYRKLSTGGVKKRASRAGTRSVSTLSVAQLERKRANDREAQRAIRQRTKDHIDGLERTLNDIKQTLDNREKLLTAAHSRNRELEEENAHLRMRLNEANITTKYSRPADVNIASAPQSAVSEASGTISQRSGSISHGFAMPNGALGNTNGAWQQQPGFTPANGALMLSTNNESRNMTGWRARDSPRAMSATTSSNLQGLHPPQTIPYTPVEERGTWSNQYEFAVNPQQNAQQFPQASGQQQDNHFAQGQNTTYQGTPQQAQTHFHPPLLAPQNDFSQAFYQYQAQGFPSQTQYQQTTNQNSNGNFASSQVQPSPVSASQYHNTAEDHTFTQQIHPPMQFRNEAEFRGYTMAQFPSG